MVDITPLLSENVKKHFITLPISHQKEWVNYINEAKKEETRLKRVLKMQMSFCEKYTLEGEPQVINLLEEIININSQEGNALAEAFINAIGNNHSGVYCVAYKWAIAFLGQLYQISQPNTSRAIAIYGILNDLYYFEPIEEQAANADNTTIKEEIKQLLAPFADKN
ncbi:YdeI/OmpD-associated family protein [Capnocytophaga sputigena]|uniref:YdeI/OmpD-associated family protein n=1 Tax=Capnocytophaga sputigena TaxID=1019 RepID=UPI0028D03245|nr:YdeI/OmpD-associated family protein [Capnocytophaga sputigena]